MQKKDAQAEIEKLFQAGVHLGHKKNRLHPKAKKYIYQMVNGFAIIDLTQTVDRLNTAKNFLKSQLKEGKKLLVVGTKKVASQFVAEICTKKGYPYISSKWLPGLLTNFETIIKNVKKMNQLEVDKTNGEWDKFVKHERMRFNKELVKLKKFYGGIAGLVKRPDLLFIIDIKKEKNALKEADQNNIPVVAILDTNSNPDLVNYPVVANDDSASSVEYLVKEILE